MKVYLLILLLILGACTDKQTTSVSQQATNEIISEQELIEVSYDKGLDLMLVQTDWDGFVSPYEYPDDVSDETFHAGNYMGIYWDQKNHQYYKASISEHYFVVIQQNKKLSLSYSLDSNLQLEPVATEEIREIFTNTGLPFLYAGSISPLERVYINPNTQQAYVKILTPVDDSYYLSTDYSSPEFRKITNSLSEPVYPVIFSVDNRSLKCTAYTNSGDIIYEINPRGSFKSVGKWFDLTPSGSKENRILTPRKDVSILYPTEKGDKKQEE